MNTLQIIDNYILKVNNKNYHKNILYRVYEYNEDFIKLDVTGMIYLLVNDMKINKISIIKNFYHVLDSFYRYLVYENIIEENIFNFISHSELDLLISKNIHILTDEDIDNLISDIYDKEEANAPYKEVVIRFCYECVVDSISELFRLCKSEVSLEKNTVRGISISNKLSSAILKMYTMDSWLYMESRRDLYSPFEIIDNKRLLPYSIKGREPSNILETRERTAHMFVLKNVFNNLKYKNYEIDPQILYCCGLTNKIVRDFGKEYLLTMFLRNRRDSKYLFLQDERYKFEYLKERYNIKSTRDILKKKLKPYALKIKYDSL